ncbi:MAG: Ni,Fe-hydrogenase III large subunit [Ferroplasma sp.]|uniref:NADH-quinone oxidoreductase subunit D-related protein n=1 Tax=Ferroplasma sp. TaxID=2591003 RepID=UPI0028162319|nr:Ni,Fe-hydrogenase III large subunit [Ferroplasma sp.]WMT52112.1 MAG: Ni,Fe-hydrogenase III large subunit [Ferroplasma sp.]
MRYYKFGEKSGRYVGRTEKYDVYSSTLTGISMDEDDHEERTQGEIYFNYGPSAGGLRESVNFSILTPGESIRDVIINSEFKRRNISIIGDNISDSLLKVERINGFHSASHSIAYTLAVEDALNMDNSDLNNARIVEIELERIRSNIDVIKGLCESAGFVVPEKQLLLLREEVARIISRAFGHRYYFSVNGINSIDGDFSRIVLNSVEKQFRSIYDGLLSSKIFLDRLQENGVVSDPVSTGPAARAANYRYDARLDSRSLDYGKYNTVMESAGDTFSRFLVRAGEIFESINIIESYDIKKTYRRNKMELNGYGEGTARIESPAGDLFYYVKIDGGRIMDIQMSSPSYLNMRNFRYALKNGNIFTDFFFVWESFGIWISELEVRFH